jgi:hypothetical protein
MTLAKALGNGMPVGACVVNSDAAQVFEPGNHGSTFGGNPLASAAALAVLDVLERENLADQASQSGEILQQLFAESLADIVGVKEIRGMGMLLAIELERPCGELVMKAAEKGLLINVTADSVIRLLPPLVCSESELHEIAARLAPVIKLLALLDRAIELKAEIKAGQTSEFMKGKTLALLFDKSSTRTRVSFETGMNQMAGSTLFLSPADAQIGRGEPIEDTARVISSMVDIVAIRTGLHENIIRFAENSAVPVINALTDFNHPCQLLADMMTVREKLGRTDNIKVAYIGDGNNMCHSWMIAAKQFGFNISIAVPQGFEPEAELLQACGDRVVLTNSPSEAIEGVDVVVTGRRCRGY